MVHTYSWIGTSGGLGSDKLRYILFSCGTFFNIGITECRSIVYKLTYVWIFFIFNRAYIYIYIYIFIYIYIWYGLYQADFRFAPSQWETSLQRNAVSHWLVANLESALYAVKLPNSLIAITGIGEYRLLWLLLLTWINFNPSMDK